MAGKNSVFFALFLFVVGLAPDAHALPIAGNTSADGVWTHVELDAAPITGNATNTRPSSYDLYQLDPFVLGLQLHAAPAEGNGSLTLSLPMPDGSYRDFNVWQRPVLDPATQARFPSILALAGEAADNARVRVVLDSSPQGFNAMVDLNGGKTWMIDQHPNGTASHVIAYRAGTTPRKQSCLCTDHEVEDVPLNAAANAVPENCVGGQLRKMDLGVAVSERVTASLGGSAGALAHVNALVNRLNLIYERDLAVRFVLVSGTTTIYDTTNREPNSYPHENTPGTGPSGTDLANSDANLDAGLGANNYDIGFSLTLFNLSGGGTAGAGLAQTPTLCLNGQGRQVSSYSSHSNNDSYVGLVAHEVGHQFGAGHTTAGNTGNCAASNGGYNAGSAVETGSGTTLMSYAGICGTDNLQNDADLYFHGFSLQQMNNWVASRSCYTVCPPDGNTIPTVNASDCTVPLRTPFTLEATAADADGDPLTYAWEQVDLSPSHSLSLPDNGLITLFRSYPPIASSTRDFPSLPGILSGVLPLGEKWPLVPRTLNFMVTVRDGANGACSHQVQVEVANAGPMTISRPAPGQVVRCSQTVTWDPAGTQNAPVNAGTVNILLSTDDGATYSTLAAGVPNDGSEIVNVPNTSISSARIRIEPASGCWWVLSEPFAIEPCPSGKIFATGFTRVDDTCGNGNSNQNGSIDPGEFGFLTSIELSATTAPVSGITGTLTPTTPGVTVLSGPQTWPDLSLGTPAYNTGPFTFSVPSSHACGSPVTFDLSLQTDQGNCTLPVQFATGRPVTNLFSYTGPTVAIPRFGNANILLPVSGLLGNIIDVDLLIDGANCSDNVPATGNGINYPAPEYIDLTLSSPGGSSILVQNGAAARAAGGGRASTSGSNICNTQYDDEAPGGTAIPTTTTPSNFQNKTFVPSNPLSSFDGENGNGSWTLNVSMPTTYGTSGSFSDRDVTAWSLRITTVVCDSPKQIADLHVTKQAPAIAEIGLPFPYTLTVTNHGPDTATRVTLTDILPAGVTSATPGPFDLGTLAPFTSKSVTINATAIGPERTLVNCAVVQSADVTDHVPTNNTNCVSTRLIDASGDLSLNVSGPGSVSCGQAIAYQLTISNLSAFAISNVVVTSTIPTTCATFVSASSACSQTAPGQVVCTIPTLGLNASTQLAINVSVSGCCGTISNRAELYQRNDTNAANNVASTSATQVPDTTDPTFGVPPPGTTPLTCNPQAGDFPDPAPVLASASDNCLVVTSWVQHVDSQTGCDLTRTSTFYAVDLCGNTGTVVGVVTWTEDNAVPTFAANPPARLDIGCNPLPGDFPDMAAVLASANDNCAVTSRSVTAITNGGPCAYTATITYEAVDICGQTGTAVTVVTWAEDLLAPTFLDCTPATTNLGCNPAPADFPDPAIVLASATDTCGVVSSWVESARSTNGACLVTMTQDFYAVDGCGLTGTCQRTLQWTESPEAPRFPAAPASILDLRCNPLPGDFPDIAAVLASAVDDCAMASRSATAITNGGPCDYTATLTWTAVDACGVTGTAVTVVRWSEDLVAPSFTDCTPASTNLGCNPAPGDFPDPAIVLASATDLCGVVSSWVESVRTTNSACLVTMVQNFYAVDGCGLTGTCQRTIQWTESSQAPRFPDAPASVLDLGCNPPPTDFPDVAAVLASAVDDCAIASRSASAVTNGGPCNYTATLMWAAIDTCGVTGTAVTVMNWTEDLIAPVFTNCTPVSTNLGCNPAPGDFPDPAIVLASATDACGITTSWVTSVETTNSDCLVTMVRTFYAKDACKQTGTCVQTISWTDDPHPPTVTCDPDMDLGCNPASIPPPSGTARDGCGPVSPVLVETPSNNGCRRTLVRVWTAVDACNQIASCTQTLHWTEDTQAPTLNCIDQRIPIDSGTPLPSAPAVTVTDDCDAPLVITTNALTTNVLGDVDTEFVYTATDCAGRSVTCRIAFVYQLPVDVVRFTCPPTQTDLGCNPAIPTADAVLASATGSCPIAMATASDSFVTNVCRVTLTRSHVAVDICGNRGTCTQVLTWTTDTTSPTFVCPSDEDLGCNPAHIPGTDAVLFSAFDICGIETSWVTTVRTQMNCQIRETRTYYAVDDCGNTGTCAHVLQWTEDQSPPTLSGCPDNALVVVLPGELPQAPVVTADDNCGVIRFTTRINPLSTNAFGVDTEYVYTAIDCAGLQAECRVLFTYDYDALPSPTIDCPGAPVALKCGSGFRNMPRSASVLASAKSPCGIVSNHVETQTVNTPCGSTITRVYTVYDACGRSTTCSDSYTSNRIDYDPPVLDVPPDTILCQGSNSDPAFTGMASASDDCGVTDISYVDTMTDNACGSTIRRTWTAKDFCGNSASLDQSIHINQGILPPLSCGIAAVLFERPEGGFLVPDLSQDVLGNQTCPTAYRQTPAAGTLVTKETLVAIVISNACGGMDACQVKVTLPLGQQAIIGNEVWEDVNADGRRDPSEPPVPNLTLQLLDAAGNTVATTQSDAQGFYQFTVDFSANPPTARGPGGALADFQIAFVSPTFLATREGIDSIIVEGTPRSMRFPVSAGDILQDKDIGLVRLGSISGVIWQDLDNDDLPDDNLAELGLNGIRVELHHVANGRTNFVAATTSRSNAMGEQGSYRFPQLLPGEYVLRIDKASLPPGSDLSPADGNLTVHLPSGGSIVTEDLVSNFHFTPSPAAAILLSLDTAFGVVQWDIGVEHNTLGYQLLELESGEPAGSDFVLADGSGRYHIQDVPPGQYSLVEIDNHLERTVLGELTVHPEVDATPTGEPTKLLEAGADGSLTFTTGADVDSYFIRGVASGAIVLDTSRPDAPVRLRVEQVEHEQGTALYFSYPAGATLQIK